MSQEHDYGAERCGGIILSHLRSGAEGYRQVFSALVCRIGDFEWPRPDYVLLDEANEATYALEYKPPLQSKREYVCGLGQSLTYLKRHTYSALIVPERADDGFRIADFLTATMSAPYLASAPLSLFVYNEALSEVQLLKSIAVPRTDYTPSSFVAKPKTFWCWWRDMSQYDLLDILRLSFKYNEAEGDIYSRHIYPEFWSKLLVGSCRDFDGRPRHLTGSEQSRSSSKQNYRIPLVQLGLCTPQECRLTERGFNLLSVGVRYGAGSRAFLDAVARLVLVEGKHLDLINLVSEIQRVAAVPVTAAAWALLLEGELTGRGMIGPRKPSAVTTGAKGSYLRDEFKLWNKFGLLRRRGSRYFVPGVGFDFDWRRITGLLAAPVF